VVIDARGGLVLPGLHNAHLPRRSASNQIELWAASIGPERASHAWVWGTILWAGGRIAFGSYWPIVPWSPWIAIHSAVHRQTASGRPPGGWHPAERITIAAALEAFTSGIAYAAFEEHRCGRIAIGKDADLAVLNCDLLAEVASAIIGTTSVATLVGGRIVHRSEGSA
jgi:predicted amidohydrolase YtcJ